MTAVTRARLRDGTMVDVTAAGAAGPLAARLHVTDDAVFGPVCVAFTVSNDAARVASARVSLTFADVAEAAVLTPAYQWEPIDRPVAVDDWTARALLLRRRDGSWLQFCGEPRGGHVTYLRTGDVVRLIQELPGPTRGFDVFGHRTIEPLADPGTEGIHGRLRFWRTAAAHDPDGWVRSRLPHGFKAAICFTDHADYDQVDALRCVFFGAKHAGPRSAASGFAAEAIPVTKSIFVRSPADYTAVGLNDAAFRRLVDELADTGNEIAAHLTRPGPTSREELREDLHALERYGLRTWIDHHFTLPQALSGQGWNPRHGHYVLDLLDDAGVHNVWSFQDIDANRPDLELNMLADAPARARMHLRAAIGADRASRPARARLYHAVEAVGMITGRSARLNLRRAADELHAITRAHPGSLASSGSFVSAAVSDMARHVWARRRHPLTPIFYRHGALVGPQSGRPFTLFATSRVNDVQHHYVPAAIDRLIADRGVHVGHLYLCCHTHALRSGAAIVVDGAGDVTLAPAFADNLRHIGARGREGALWCATLDELAGYYELSSRVEVEPQGDGTIRISNPTDRPVPGFTIVPTRNVAAAPMTATDRFVERRSAGWRALSVDLAAHASVVFRAQSFPAGTVRA